MNNILLFEFDIDGKFLSIYCGMLEDSYFSYAFFDGKSASRIYQKGECRLFKYQFQALENFFTPEYLKFSLYGEISIACDIKISQNNSIRSSRGLGSMLPRNARVEFISQFSEFFGEVTINGKTHHIKSYGYIHRISARKLPERFYALNLLGKNICLASYMGDNAFWIYNFNSFLTSGIISGDYYRFVDYNFSTISVADNGNQFIIRINKGKTDLVVCAECGNEQLLKLNNRMIRANNYTRADVLLRQGDKEVFRDRVPATLLISGKIKVGKDVEMSKFCEAAT